MIQSGALLETVKVQTVFPNDGAATTVALAAGTSDVNSVGVDTQGFDSLSILIRLGTVTATGTGTFKIQGSDDNSTYVDIEGSAQTWADTDSNYQIGWGYGRLVYRYYRVATDRATANTAISSMVALLSNSKLEAVTQLTSTGQFLRAPEIVALASTGTA